MYVISSFSVSLNYYHWHSSKCAARARRWGFGNRFHETDIFQHRGECKSALSAKTSRLIEQRPPPDWLDAAGTPGSSRGGWPPKCSWGFPSWAILSFTWRSPSPRRSTETQSSIWAPWIAVLLWWCCARLSPDKDYRWCECNPRSVLFFP